MTLKDVAWRLTYDKLWAKFASERFRFEDAVEQIFGKKNFSSAEIKYASKLLNEIEDKGYATHIKASYDKRVRLYKLLNPEKVSGARAVYIKVWERTAKKGGNFTVLDLIKETRTTVKWNYVHIKDSAIGFHSNCYRSVDILHLSVYEEDADGWIALFKLWNSSILIGGETVHQAGDKKQPVHLHTDLKNRTTQLAEMNSLHYQPAHYAVAEALKDGDILGAFAVILRKKNLEWKKLTSASKEYGVINTLGFCLEAINLEAGKEVFDEETVKKIAELLGERTEVIGREAGDWKTVKPLTYVKLEEKWNVRCYNSGFFRKIVEDLL